MQRVPNYSQTDDCTGIISLRRMDRLTDMLNEARDRQSRIMDLEPGGRADRDTRRMPISPVLDPAPDLRIMQEEIFGPILPVVPYDDVEEAVAAINAGERPLGFYVSGDDEDGVDRILGQVISGGAAVNTCALQGALPSLALAASA